MKVPKYPYACAICQETFNNLTILGKHVEFRHSSAEQPPKSKCGSVRNEKDLSLPATLSTTEFVKLSTTGLEKLSIPELEKLLTIEERLLTNELEKLPTPEHEKLSKPELEKLPTPEHEKVSKPELENLSTSELEKLSIPDLEKILEKLSTSELEKMPTPEPAKLSKPDCLKVSTPELEKLSTPKCNKEPTPFFEAFIEKEDEEVIAWKRKRQKNDIEDSSLNLNPVTFTKKDMVVTQKKTVLNQNSNKIMMNGGISKSQIHGRTPESFVETELNKVDNYLSSYLKKKCNYNNG